MKTMLMTIALVAAAIAAPALAQMPAGGMQADVTRAQAQVQAATLFARLDLNHDGVVTRAEAEQFAAQMSAARGDDGGAGAGGGQGGGNRIERMIARAMGDAPSITLAQFQAQALVRFDAMDLNHDGVVTSVERQQARASRAAQGNPGQ